MNRLTLIKLHLFFTGLILVFLTFTALSGSLHLLTGDETEQVREIKSLVISNSVAKDELTNIFKKELKHIDSDYQFGYIKGSGTSLISRPTTRKFYTISAKDGVAIIKEHTPSLRMRVMELHKGHGPRISRNILGILGIIVFGAILSGLWLGLSSKHFRKVTLVTMLSGAFIYFILFFL